MLSEQWLWQRKTSPRTLHGLVLPLAFPALYLSIWVVLFYISNGFFTKKIYCWNLTFWILKRFSLLSKIWDSIKTYFGLEDTFVFWISVVDCRAPGGSYYSTSYCASTNLFGSCTSYENQYFGGGGGGIGEPFAGRAPKLLTFAMTSKEKRQKLGIFPNRRSPPQNKYGPKFWFVKLFSSNLDKLLCLRAL